MIKRPQKKCYLSMISVQFKFEINLIEYLFDILQQINMSLKKNIPVLFDLDACIICNQKNCLQSFDHSKIQFKQFKDLIFNAKQELPEIDTLKNQISKNFIKIKQQIFIKLKEKQGQMMKLMNQFYFYHLDENKINFDILNEVLQNKIIQGSRKINSKTINTLSKKKSRKYSPKQIQSNLIISETNKIFNSFDMESIIQKIQNQLDINQLRKNININHLTNSVRSTKSAQTNSSISSEKVIESNTQCYEWKYIKFTKNSKLIELNNRRITDEEMMTQIPIISTYDNIKQFQIRNNKITNLSCSLIASNMPFLKVLDLRGNKVGDLGVSKIVKNMPNLKSLFISETGITDVTGQLIVQYLPQLDTLWSEHTNLTGEICLKISQKQKMRVISLLGNPISEDFKKQIRHIFSFKGYLSI